MYFRTELVVEHQLYLDNLFTDARDTLAPSGARIRISFSSDALIRHGMLIYARWKSDVLMASPAIG